MRTSRAFAAALALLLALTACLPRGVNGADTLTPNPSPSAEPGPPHPPQIDTPLLIGAYWYPWYGADGRHWREGYRGTPLLGEYDSADPDVIRRQIAWASDYGISFFAASWWGRDSFEDTVTKGPFLHVLVGQSFRFAVLYEAPGLLSMENGRIPLDDDAIKHLTEDLTYLAATYFDHPNYLTIDGRPVLFIYLTRVFTGDVGEALGQVRETLHATTGTDLFIIGDEVYWHAPAPSRLAPFEGVTAYNMHTSVSGVADGFADRVSARFSLWADAASREGVAFVPDVIPGFDDTAVRPQAAHPVIPRSPELLSAQLQDALAVASGPARVVMITSWNEWHEDTSIEPSEEAGLAYLEALRDIVTTARKIQ